jgi:hypothetical protein
MIHQSHWWLFGRAAAVFGDVFGQVFFVFFEWALSRIVSMVVMKVGALAHWRSRALFQWLWCMWSATVQIITPKCVVRSSSVVSQHSLFWPYRLIRVWERGFTALTNTVAALQLPTGIQRCQLMHPHLRMHACFYAMLTNFVLLRIIEVVYLIQRFCFSPTAHGSRLIWFLKGVIFFV